MIENKPKVLSSTHSPDRNRWLGSLSIGAGVSVFILCELPLLLALVGLAGLGTSTFTVRRPPWVEVAAFLAVVLGIALVARPAIRRIWLNKGMDRT